MIESVATLVESLQKLVAPFSDPVLKEFGSYIAEKIRFVRFKNSLRTLERAKLLLEERGIHPRPVAPKILVPLLEGAGLEEEEELMEAWSQLLASAASGGRVLPIFPKAA